VSYTRAVASIKFSPVAARKVRLADPVAVLIARCQARAWLVKTGDLELIEAVDGLQAGAIKLGLVASIGQDAVQQHMADAFAAIQPVVSVSQAPAAPTIPGPEPAASPGNQYDGLSYSFAKACRLADRARGPLPDADEPYRLVSRDGVPSAAELQRVYEQTMAANRKRYGPPTSVVKLAEWLVQFGDAGRFEAWLASRPPRERGAIVNHIKAVGQNVEDQT
jgi:hypothetical protein